MRYGSLFSGYGGLDLGLQSVLGGSTAWHVEFDKHPSAILAHHWPDVPNYGDITKVDFTAVEPVDVLTGGFPCQDVSHAGRRAGLIRDGEGRTRSGLWGEMLRAITGLRPRLVVAENVRGLLSAKADSDVEPCTWCMGDAGASPMRALGAVLADLADVGMHAWWVGLRAADVGAAHGRFRVFIFAVPAADAEHWRLGDIKDNAARQPEPAGCSPRDQGERSDSARPELTLPPTPACNDMGGGKTVEQWDGWTEKMQAKHGNGHGKSLAIEAQRLLPTPTVNDAGNVGGESQFDRNSVPLSHALLPTPRATDGTKGGPNQRGSSGDLMLPTPRARDHQPESYDAGMRRTTPQLGTIALAGVKGDISWGDYAPAIARWETVIGRPAPAPTEPGPKGNPRLSAPFVEWLMGLPEGHVTGVDIPRNAQLKALGNGVVPQQSAAACRWWLTQIRSAAA